MIVEQFPDMSVHERARMGKHYTTTVVVVHRTTVGASAPDALVAAFAFSLISRAGRGWVAGCGERGPS